MVLQVELRDAAKEGAVPASPRQLADLRPRQAALVRDVQPHHPAVGGPGG